ncbi:sigma-70 family RNA polymerase sigma factor [Sphingobacterium sp. DR205]|uniref:RNA polymerase sigma factor n=1 Tax=Sphingobacterium sp. DR205 TaxID=2713573 RepID=UPI0013E42AC0|nr:sigma-70 family RNA polymerase sigma factor [Sphingobacterium sp. DR205]QIH32755.1 sigma-70 family RNA polymerase sigma factor [Sphingobacterium sp. DR205]
MDALKIWNSIKTGDSNSFLALYDSLYTALFRYGLKINADREVVKESIHILFCDLWEKREKLPMLTTDPKYYLFVWLKRVIYKQHTYQNIPLEDLLHTPIEDSIESQKIIIEETLERDQALRAAMDNLTKKQHRYIDLKFFQNKSYEEIADMENAALRTVYNVVHEAIKKLKGSLSVVIVVILNFSK